MRPSKEVLDQFYGLAELDTTTRFKAVAAVIAKVSADATIVDYTIERLVAGLSSTRAAARLGYASTLSILLEMFHDQWTAEKLFELADKKMDLKDKETAAASGIGHHLLATCLINSSVYHHNNSVILERELALMRQFPFLAMTVALSIAEMAAKVDTKTFKKTIIPSIKAYLEGSLDAASPEFIYLTFLLREKHASVICDLVSFVKKSGECRFESNHLHSLLLTLKKCDKGAVKVFLGELLKAARQAKQFGDVYKHVVEKWSTSGDESKVLERIFQTAEMALEGGNDCTEVIAVFSPELMKRISHVTKGKQSPEHRVLKNKITSFCTAVGKGLTTVTDGDSILKLVEAFDRIGNFDALTNSHLTAQLIARMDEPTVSKWIESCPSTSIRRACGAFSEWSDASREAALLNMVGREKKSDDVLYTVANCVDSVFRMKVRSGEQVSVVLSPEFEAVLKKVVTSFAGNEVKKTLKGFTNETMKRPLSVLWLCLRLWKQLTSSKEEETIYEENMKEVETIAKDTGKINNQVLVDLLISLLGQPQKFHRTVVYFVYIHMLPSITKEDVSHIIDSLMMDDAELSGNGAGDAGGSDAEAGSASEDEGAESGEDEEEEEKDDDELSIDSESEAGEEVDPQLVSRLQNALGTSGGKVDSNADSDSEASLSDMDDEAMFAMDEKLTAAFQSIASQQPKTKKQSAVAMQSFRSKVTDLLLFTVSAVETPADVKLSMIIPLLSLAKVQLKRSSDGPCTKKTTELLEIISKLKKLSVSEKRVSKLLSKLVSESIGVSNPVLLNTIASLAVFLLSVSSVEGAWPESIRAAFFDVFRQFMQQEDGQVACQLATAPIYKFPTAFVSDLPAMLELAFDEQYRVFRRTEAVLCVASIFTKPVTATVSINKSIVKEVASKCVAYLTAATSEGSEEVKPRFFAAVLKLVLNAANSADEKTKVILSKNLLPCVEQLTANEELWKKQMKKCNSASSQICGKLPLHVLKAVDKALA